jgi:hypothetical protein
MLRKTVTSAHGEGDAKTKAAAAGNDAAKIASATEEALAAADKAAALTAREEELRNIRARAAARTGMRMGIDRCSC